MQIDLSPIFNTVVAPLLQTGLLGLVGWGVAQLSLWLKFKLTQGQRDFLIGAVDNAVSYAQAKLAAHETVTTDQTTATALAYLLPKVSETMAKLGITPAHLSEIITARIPAAGGLLTTVPAVVQVPPSTIAASPLRATPAPGQGV